MTAIVKTKKSGRIENKQSFNEIQSKRNTTLDINQRYAGESFVSVYWVFL